ncbi:hypothetical protein M0Q50_06025 [bacterium]|jgi:hypothetical protein|nr:hypothetical protein [bacterium]
MKLFNNTAILTSKNPEAFLCFTKEESDYKIIPSSSVSEGMLYVNGIDITKYEVSIGYALTLDASFPMVAFHVYSPINYNFDTSINFAFYNSSLIGPAKSTGISILNRPFIVKDEEINTYENNNILVDDIASYLLMRTNPKFSGNIMLVIDESSNMYLDTFKVSDILSNKKYRHQLISGNSVLSSDIRNVFSTLPLGELYRVDVDNTLQIGIPKTEVKDQFNVTYNYGAKLFKDELYPEDNLMLAPIWINSKLPDYFSVFRLNGTYNSETYDGSSLINLAFKYLKESDIIKTWSISNDKPIGKYLNTHITDLEKIQAPVFLSLTNPTQNEADPNTWYGIAVDKGVMTGRSETTYFFNQKANNFTDLNAFISQGFERNTLLCPNLINLGFAFSDNDVSLYTMNRYFGLYLTENILYKVGYYANNSTGNIEIISLDNKDSSIFIHSDIFDISGNLNDVYKNRILVINDNIELKRITNVSQINDSSLNKYTSKPYNNIFSINVEEITTNPFMLFTLKERLQQGEHLRVVNHDANTIWEVFATDSSSYDCLRYVSFTPAYGIYPKVYRTYFDINGDIEYQTKQIADAFDLFSNYSDAPFRTGLYGKDWVSIILNNDASMNQIWKFQRITSSTLDPSILDISTNDPIIGFNNASSFSDIEFFGVYTPDASNFVRISYDASYGPIDFELFGDRQLLTFTFINPGINHLYSFDSSKNILDKFEIPTLYQSTDNWYRKLLNFQVKDLSHCLYIKDPLHIHDNVIIMTSDDISLINNRFNAYNIYPINISLMGINPVKDIDYTIYDSSSIIDSSKMNFTSEYFYNREDDISTFSVSVKNKENYTLDIQGSYVIVSGEGTITQNSIKKPYYPNLLMNTFNSSIYFEASTNTVISYGVLDGSYNYKSYKNNSSEELIKDYFDSSTLLKYGLIVPLVSKWVGLGSDARNNPLRLILNNNILDVSTNFIPTDEHFTQEITYPSYKYLTPGKRAWENYIFYDINDVLYDASSNSYKSFKELIFDNPYVDYFSKLVYANHNVNATKTRSSLTYYNQYKNTIDTLFLGVNYSFYIQNIAKNILDIKNYNKYRFSFISTPSKNKTNARPIEVIINENNKTILMIWYQGNDELNYNMRYSSFLPGKALLDPSNNGFVTKKSPETWYSFVKTPFIINNSSVSKKLVNLYGIADGINTNYEITTVQPYAQFNKMNNGFNSIFIAPNRLGNTINGNILYVADGDKNYQTFSQYIDYIYTSNYNTYGSYTVNYGYNYGRNDNYYENNTTNLTSLKYYLASSRTSVMYYIIRGDEIITSLDFGKTINPIIITINPPREYGSMTTYNGWFKPKFNNIFEFKANEDNDIINTINKDFIFANTNLRTYNNIPQLWYNKVTSNVTSLDVSVGNAISYVKDYNVFKSLWDANYYNIDNTLVNGYNCSLELSSFFGSKLPKLPNQITLDKWDNTTLSYTSNTTEIIVNYNLTRSILSLFKTNSIFLNNWSTFLNISNSNNVIDDYIKNTIITYYNISQPKIIMNFYYKSYDNNIIHNEYDNSFINDNKQNFNGQLIYQNDEYIYRVIIPKVGKFSYYLSFILTEK